MDERFVLALWSDTKDGRQCGRRYALTWAKEQSEDDEKIQDVRANSPVDEEAVVPLEEKFPNEDCQYDVIKDGEQPGVLQILLHVTRNQ